MKTKNVFRDGQTLRSYIAPVEGLHTGLRFERRPMLAEDVEETEAQIAKATPRQAAQIVTLAVVSKLVSWSEIRDDGSAQAINAATVGALPYSLLNKLYRIVAGLIPGDPDPDAAGAIGTNEAETFLSRLKEATERRTTVGAQEQADREGN